MTEEDLRIAVSDPHCPFTYQELWDMFFGPRGPSIGQMIHELEREEREKERQSRPELPPLPPYAE
jgi:hypothetical protein